MKRKAAVTFGVILALAGLPASVSVPVLAGPSQVRVVDSRFNPPRVRVAPGGKVRWSSRGTNEEHNVVEDHGLFTSGDLTSDPIAYTVGFSSGTFPYYCENHGAPGGRGMSGVVAVPVALGDAPRGRAFTVLWATSPTRTGSNFDVQFRVGSGEWRAWKTNTKGLKAVFGRGNKPVRLVRGKRYSFRARSRRGEDASGWAPVRSIRA